MLTAPRAASIRLSVVVPAYQAADVLPDQLDALVRQDTGDFWEIIVVDNRSSDGTTQIVGRYADVYPRIRLVEAPEQANVSYARNVGAAAARGSSVAFVDADDIVAPGWLKAIDAALVEHELVAGALDYDRLNPVWAVKQRGPAQRDGFFYIDGGPQWPLIFAANLGVSKRRHEQVGGFDETLPWGGEDADYVWRLQALGVTPVWVPDAVVHYRLRRQLRPIYRQSVGYARSRWELYSRYLEVWPVPPTAATRGQLVRQSLLLLRRVRSWAGVAYWVSRLGWAVGSREGALSTSTEVGRDGITG